LLLTARRIAALERAAAGRTSPPQGGTYSAQGGT